jgi:transcriptional regulator with XRE-family HTH domain
VHRCLLTVRRRRRPSHARDVRPAPIPDFDLSGLLRRIRRRADLSQRELSASLRISKGAVAAAETGSRGMDARVLAHAAALADLRLVVVDAAGDEVPGMSPNAVRDGAGRQFPAHVDTRYVEEGWWHDNHHYARRRPWYTFDRERSRRDALRRSAGMPDDHQLPRPGDSPGERAAARALQYWRRRAGERERAFLAGASAGRPDAFTCTCPPGCDELDDRSGPPVHTGDCPCSCDLA